MTPHPQPRKKCNCDTCFANFNRECFAECDIIKARDKMLDDLIEFFEEKKAIVVKQSGGAIGLLFGITDHLKKLRSTKGGE